MIKSGVLTKEGNTVLCFISDHLYLTLTLTYTYNTSRQGNVALLFTHPYAILGGNKDNNVPDALYNNFRDTRGGKDCLADIVIKYNSRGVGGSSGWPTLTAWKERQDALAVLDYLVNEMRVEHIWIVGYSCGAAVACGCADERDEVAGVIAIGYPKGFMAGLLFSSHYPLIAATEKPKFFILGDRDQFASVSSFQKWFQSEEMRGKDKELEIVLGADHFWFGMEGKLCTLVRRWLLKVSPYILREN